MDRAGLGLTVVRVVAAVLAGAALVPSAHGQTEYPLTRDSERQADVPAGKVTRHAWTSRIFPGTQRDYWVYVPAQYRPEAPAAVMVFQDGARFVAEDGRWRVPIVFDNLIAHGQMPVTIAVLVDPGVLPAGAADQQARYDRSFEYDALGDRYARFLLEELLPEVGRSHALTSDPNLRAIGGSSSGASCAFTVAWNRPDAFRRVLSFIGSYTGLRGGDTYPTLIRKAEPRPLRVFLEDGSRDLDIYSGNWWIGNQAMHSALEYAGYDVRFERGDRGHDSIHGSAVFPDALRWLWRGWTEPITPSPGKGGAERHFVTEILDPAAPRWEIVARGEGAIGGVAVGTDGDVYFSDSRAIRRVAHQTGTTSVFNAARGAGALMFGPDRRLFAARGGRIVAYGEQGDVAVTAGGERGHFVVGARGELWVADPRGRRVSRVDPKGRRRVSTDHVEPGVLALSPDQALLSIAAPRAQWVWSYQVGADGTLHEGQAFYRLETGAEPSVAVGGMAVDTEGFLYVATEAGVQVFDAPGRLNAILASPPGPAAKIVFGGPQLDTLYAASGETLFRRKLRRKGVFPWQPVKPPVPRL